MRFWLLRRRGRLVWGRGVRVGRDVRITVAPGARVILEDGVRVGAGTRLTVRAGVLRVGAGAVIGERCVVVVLAGIEVAPGARIGDWVALADFEPIADDIERPTREQGVRARTIRVGERAVVGHAAVVGPGVSVAPDARVGAHEVAGA